MINNKHSKPVQILKQVKYINTDMWEMTLWKTKQKKHEVSQKDTLWRSRRLFLEIILGGEHKFVFQFSTLAELFTTQTEQSRMLWTNTVEPSAQNCL